MMILQILSAFSAVLVFTMILEIPKNICFMRPPRVRWAGGPT